MTTKRLDPATLRPITNTQHTAYRCRDAEQTRWFWEDVLGLKLAAALAFEEHSGVEGLPRKYMHLFFAMGDGNLVAFFDDPDHVESGFFDKKMDGFTSHIALEVKNEDDMLAMQKRIQDAGITCLGPLDHGFAKSVYFFDPNNIQAELICKTSGYNDIMSKASKEAHKSIEDWCRQTRAQKERLFGAASLDRRGKPKATAA
jgi:catechol 2,3-dioxygenase-like lactoylglutathione lyase family enzyme